VRRGEQLELALELERFPAAHDAWHWTPESESGPRCGGAWSGLGGLVPELERVRTGLGVAACAACLELEAAERPPTPA